MKKAYQKRFKFFLNKMLGLLYMLVWYLILKNLYAE